MALPRLRGRGLPDGKVEHTQYCVVGKAELNIAGDVFYEPPAGDAGLEEFFAG